MIEKIKQSSGQHNEGTAQKGREPSTLRTDAQVKGALIEGLEPGTISETPKKKGWDQKEVDKFYGKRKDGA